MSEKTINNGHFVEMTHSALVRYADDEGHLEARDNGSGALVIEIKGKDYHNAPHGTEPKMQTLTMVVDKKNVAELLIRMARVTGA